MITEKDVGLQRLSLDMKSVRAQLEDHSAENQRITWMLEAKDFEIHRLLKAEQDQSHSPDLWRHRCHTLFEVAEQHQG